MPDGWVQVAQEALKVPGILAEIYGDLAKPGVRQVGKALETIVGLGNTILWPATWANERTRIYLEKNLELYRKRLESIPTEKVAEVAPEVGVPIAEKLAYVRDPSLADLYVSLLAKASCVDTVNQAHPSFVNVINNLSPDEARLLKYFVSHLDLVFVRAKWVDPETGFYSFAGQTLLDPSRLSGLTFPENAPAYISNLAGLGLITVHHDRAVQSDAPHVNYDVVEAHWRNVLPKKYAKDPNRVLRIEHGVICCTEFGRKFIQACHQ